MRAGDRNALECWDTHFSPRPTTREKFSFPTVAAHCPIAL